MDSSASNVEETVEEYVIEYYESNEASERSNMTERENISKIKTQNTSNIEKRSQIYTCYVKEEPRNIDEISRIRADYNELDNEPSSSIIPESILPETIITQSCVPEIIVPELESNISLEPRKRGRPKKKSLSILTPMEISNNHDTKTSGETLECDGEHLYAGLLGRTRRTTRQIQDETDEMEWSEENEAEDDDSSVKRGRPFGSVKNRGKGRGRTRSTGSGRGRGRKIKEKEEIDVNSISLNNEQDGIDTEIIAKVYPDVKCGKCKEEFQRREWYRHNLLRHNDTGWLDNETPIDYDADEKLLKKVLINAIKKRKGQLSCEQCGTIKRSVVGFLSHIRFCGKSETERLGLMVQCPKCKSSVKPTSMYTHERNCQKEINIANLTENEQNSVINVNLGKSKRKAAEKAVSKISEFTTAVGSNTEKVTPHTIKHFIQKPSYERKVSVRLKTVFREELERKGIACCRQPGCEFYGNNLEIICQHHSKCNFTIQENYICKVCNLHSLIHKEIMDHVLEKHTAEDNTDNSIDPDHNMKSEESSETSDLDNDNPKEIIVTKLRFIPEKIDEKLRAYRAEFLDREPVFNPKNNVPYSPTYRWTLEFELKNYQLKLFDDLMPNNFILLSKDEGDNFLPELKHSMAMKRQNCEISDFSISDNFDSEWKYWQRFEGEIVEDVPTFFVGGPVWAIAWLPIPIPMFSYEPIQYLAVSTHPKMESEYSVGQAYSGRNVIQIWNLGSLHVKKHTQFVPKLSYAVAHNGGTIWCMEWCPSGCYQDQRIGNFDKNHNKVKRMGLLAAAFSTGFVHIYSLPFPEELLVSVKDKNQFPIYKVNPVQVLVVNIAFIEKKKQTWQCTKLSWTKENGHNILAAGFSNGYIALWNLTTQSPLLKKKQGNTALINSFRHFYAHNHSVSMISMIPYGEKRFLVSAGMDRCYKVWDLEQPNCVECVTTRGLAVDGAWMNNWPCSVLSYDDALGLSHTNSQLIPLREHSYKYFPVLATNSPTYAISVSDHANAIAQGNLAGEIVTIFPNQVLYKDIENYLNKKRWLCSYVQVTDFKSPEIPADNQSTKDKKEYQYKPTTYAECSERFGISFSEDFKTFRTCKAKQLKEKLMNTDQLETVSIEQYPFASVNRISWNGNGWSHLWFAAGYQNGFIRILNFNSICNTYYVDKLLPQFAKEMIEKENNGIINERDEQNKCSEEQEDLR